MHIKFTLPFTSVRNTRLLVYPIDKQIDFNAYEQFSHESCYSSSTSTLFGSLSLSEADVFIECAFRGRMTVKLHQHWRKSAEDWIQHVNGNHMKANVDESFPFLDSTASGLTRAHAAGLNGGASKWMEKLTSYCTYYCVSLTSFSTRKHRVSSNPSHSIQLLFREC